MFPDDMVSLLSAAANNGSMDISQWPRILQSLQQRLDTIVRETFPIPTIPSSSAEPSQFPQFASQPSNEPNSISSSYQASSQRTLQIETGGSPNTQSISSQSDKLPTALQSFYDSIKKNLSNAFTEKPPHTVQRLAELLLVPNKNYKTLPAFLRAVDRVVSVSSTSDVFPLPYATLDTNGVLGPSSEDFNGAALTRIPWLSDDRSEWLGDGTEMVDIEARPVGTDLRTESTSLIDGPNGAGSVETVTVEVNAATRLTDRSQSDLETVDDRGKVSETSAVDAKDAVGEEDLAETIPHVRGPEEIGVEDTGPQTSLLSHESEPVDSIELAERAVGRPGEGERSGTAVGDDQEDIDPDPMSFAEDSTEEVAQS